MNTLEKISELTTDFTTKIRGVDPEASFVVVVENDIGTLMRKHVKPMNRPFRVLVVGALADTVAGRGRDAESLSAGIDYSLSNLES